MSFPTYSNISQDNTKILEKQQQEIQWRHKEEQQLLLQLEEVVRLYWAEHTAQKARREVEEKTREEAERQRVAEEEKKKKRMLEYLQQLWDEVLEEEAILLERAEESQVMRSKYKEVIARNEEEQWPSKRTRGKQPEKYHRGATVKMGDVNPCERCVSARQDCLVYPSRWVFFCYTYYYFF